MSSTHSARCGKSDETSMPLCPYFLNCQGDASSGVSPLVNWLGTLPKLSGSCWPSYFLSAGLGSKVSMWLGAPTMNRKITDLAFAGKCCGLGASGFSRAAAKPSRSSRYCRASAPNPCAARVSTSRRVMAGRMCSMAVLRESSGDINELISIEQCQAKIRERAATGQELLTHFHLDGLGRARQRQLVCAPQLKRAVVTAFAVEARGKTVRFFSHEIAVE